MRNIKLLVEYDGTNYCGWQRQDNARTIQGEIEAVLSRVLRENVAVIGAGRTDAGVHARGQVANFRTDSSLQLHEIYRALNGLLPEDIIISHAEEVSLDFHSRFSAKGRMYTYTISRVPTAMMRNYSWQLFYDLNFRVMQSAAATVIGVHDFRSFCKSNAEVDHHRCNVSSACWHENGILVRFEIHADRFLHGMVRALVGAMVDVGRAFTSLEGFVHSIEKQCPTESTMTAPAKGLVLESVDY
jgi:tRNA pseudouridine38-40 synthase